MTLQWSYAPTLRSCNASGTKVYLFRPHGQTGRVVGPPSYEEIYEERELVNHTLDPYYYGARASCRIFFEAADGHVTAASGYDELTTVLQNRFSTGHYLQLGLNATGTAATDTTADYKTVVYVGSTEWQMPGGKSTGLGVELEFVAAAIQTTIPAPDSGTW